MPKRRNKNRLRAFIEEQTVRSNPLPLTHIARLYSLDEILDGDELLAEKCDVFPGKLIYLFYGRPAFRTTDSIDGDLMYRYPCVFVFRPNSISAFKRVFPCDSGAFKEKYYAEYFDPKTEITELELKPVIESAQKVVSAFFVNNENYYDANAAANLQIPRWQFAAEGLFSVRRQRSIDKAA